MFDYRLASSSINPACHISLIIIAGVSRIASIETGSFTKIVPAISTSNFSTKSFIFVKSGGDLPSIPVFLAVLACSENYTCLSMTVILSLTHGSSKIWAPSEQTFVKIFWTIT